MIDLATLRQKLSPLLGANLEARVQLPHPGLRYGNGEKGCGTWKDEKPFETNPNLIHLIRHHFWRPGIVGPTEPPAAQRLLMRYDLKGKSAYNAVPEHGLSQIDSYHLNCGHEMTHAFACLGGRGGKALFFIDLLLLPSAIVFVMAFLPILFDKPLRVELILLFLAILVAWWNLAPSDQPTKLREKKGFVNSYSREEVVAEIGAILLTQEIGQIKEWHTYSVKLIAYRLSAISPEYRINILAEAFKDASLRRSRWAKKLQQKKEFWKL